MNTNSGVNKNTVLFISSASSFFTPFMFSTINIALPTIGQEFAMDAVLLSWVSTVFFLTATIFLVPFGRVADIHGRKKVFTLGVIIFTFASLIAAFSNSALMLISFRILQALGSAMTSGTGQAIITSTFPVGERGKAFGINSATVYLGLSTGPFIGGVLTQHFGWRSIFLSIVPFGLIVIALVVWKLKGEWAESKGEKFDFIGSVVFSLTLIAIMYGFSLLPGIGGILLVAAGTFGVLAFIRLEMKTESPVLEMNLFKQNPIFAFSNLAALIIYCSTVAVSFLLSLYLQYIMALSPQNAGVIMMAQPVVMTIFSPFTGRLSDIIEPRIVASMGMAFFVAGLAMFIFLEEDTAMWFIVAGMVILGFGFALFSSPNVNAIMGAVDKKYYGIATATIGTMRMTGQMLGMGIAGLIFALFIGKAQITPEYYPAFLKSMKVGFAIFAALTAGGIFVSLARGNVRENN